MPQSLTCLVVGATAKPQLHAWIVMGAVEGLGQQNDKLSQGLSTWKGWLPPEGFVTPKEGCIGLVLLVPLL